MIKISNLYKSYDDKVIFDDFSLTLDDKKVNCILGESGIGKSTLLNILASLERYDSGNIEGDSLESVSYAFQDDKLIPYLTVKKNLELFLYNYYDEKSGLKELDRILNMLNILEVKNKYPRELSGGIKQRVNIARALLKPSKLILLDEPFKSLDYKTKYCIIKEMKKILEKQNRMVIFVTHDVDEAISMDGRIIVLSGNPIVIKKVFEDNLLEEKENIINMI